MLRGRLSVGNWMQTAFPYVTNTIVSLNLGSSAPWYFFLNHFLKLISLELMSSLECKVQTLPDTCPRHKGVTVVYYLISGGNRTQSTLFLLTYRASSHDRH